MDKYEIIKKIEQFAPLETQEKWDCSGWIVDNDNIDINKVMIALTPTWEVFFQAMESNCDLIISHHPLFCVPYEFRDIDIYASHTPMDKVHGGTTDTLIKRLGYKKQPKIVNDFVRVIDMHTNIDDILSRVYEISPNFRLVNNLDEYFVNSIAFCAGSGSEFIESTDADVFITGDLKYHTAAESDKILIDIGHFESEIGIKNVFKYLLSDTGIKVEMANEESPFI